MPVIIMCPRCLNTAVRVFEYINVARIYDELEEVVVYDDFEVEYLEHTGHPIMYQCQYRNCMFEWYDPQNRTTIDEVLQGGDMIVEVPDAR
jgi:hypothetical protein